MYSSPLHCGFAIHRIPTQSFAANEMDLLLELLTYNLFERFKHHCCYPPILHRSAVPTRVLSLCRCARLSCASDDLKAVCPSETKGSGDAWSKKVFYWNECIIPTYVLEIPLSLRVGRGNLTAYSVF